MKINKYGVVILTEGQPRIEGWNIEREPNDPKDATDEQLLLGFAIKWAEERFRVAVNSQVLDVFRDNAKKKLKKQLDDLPSIPNPSVLIETSKGVTRLI